MLLYHNAKQMPSRLLEINLTLFGKNISNLLDESGMSFMSVVKANAYGLGSIPIAKQALRAGASFLGVATCEEAFELTAAGITAPILILSELCEPVSKQLACQNCHFTAYTDTYLTQLNHLGQTLNKVIPVHIKLNTGMNRIGVSTHEAEALIQHLNTLSHIKLVGIMTHLACAGTPDHPLNIQQITLFKQILDRHSFEDMWIHAYNSDALKHLKKEPFNLGRCGIGSYRNIVTLKSQVGFMHSINKGESIGYEAAFIAPTSCHIATLPFGYADGIPSTYGINGGHVLIRGSLYPVVGRVCMDMMMVNLCDNVLGIQERDEVVLIGKQEDASISLGLCAKWSNRSEYEALCAIGTRVERRYFYR